MDEKIQLAKRQLYSLLLKKDDEELTENEVDILFSLSKDEQIQKFLDEKLKDENKNN